MATPYAETYNALMFALEDATLRLHELLDEADTPPPLDRQTWDRLMGVIEEMEELYTTLDQEPETVWREAYEDRLHATMDEIERGSS